MNLTYCDSHAIPAGSVIKKNPTRCNNVSELYSIFIWSSTCFRRHTAHHQEPKIALAASGFSYVEGCWPCSWWTLCLTTSTNYTANISRFQTCYSGLVLASVEPDCNPC